MKSLLTQPAKLSGPSSNQMGVPQQRAVSERWIQNSAVNINSVSVAGIRGWQHASLHHPPPQPLLIARYQQDRPQ